MEFSCGKYCGQSNKSLGFVRRNLYPRSENTKRSAYVSIVRPNLEYATAVWDPHRREQIELKQSSGVQPDLSKETITELLPLQKCYSH